MDVVQRALTVLIVLPFVISGLSKLLDFREARAEISALGGLKPAALWAAMVIAAQLGGSALLLAGHGRVALLGALVLAGFTVVATVLAHAWWTKTGIERARDFNVFWEHVAIVGALLLAAWRPAQST